MRGIRPTALPKVWAMPYPGRTRSQRGQALVEMALAVPILLVLVMGIIDFGWALRHYVTITNAAREGARLAIVACDSAADVTTVKNRVVDHSSGILALANVSVDANAATTGNQDCSTTTPAEGGEIKVAVSYTYEFITPLGNLVSSLGGTSITLSSSTTMRAEN